MKEYNDYSDRLNIDLPSSDDQYADLEYYERKINSEFKVKTINKLDGLDSFYWDFDFGVNTLVLHMQHYMGLSIHMKEKQNNQLLRKIATTIIKESESDPATSRN